jgi:putative pantetheine hydrolase
MSRPPVQGAGPANSLADIAGLRVGHATLDGPGWLTGVTVILAPPAGATGGVDARGGSPGTRETDLLDPVNQVEKVNAIVLSGGSAYGLAAAHGVMTALAGQQRGVRVGPDPAQVVPIVPAAILFDLGRGGAFGNVPGPEAGLAAFEDALADDRGALHGPGRPGNIGAGTGALAGQLKGGIGSASQVLGEADLGPAPGSGGTMDDGNGRRVTVAALAAVNAVGSVADPRTGELYGARFGLPGEFDWLVAPDPAELQAGADWLDPRPREPRPRELPVRQAPGGAAQGGDQASDQGRDGDGRGDGQPGRGAEGGKAPGWEASSENGPGGQASPSDAPGSSRSAGQRWPSKAVPRPLNTTIGVVATDASLTKAQCAKLAAVAQDGLARAIRPAHSMFDGDTIFALATGEGPPATPLEFHAILSAAADCFTRAITHGVLAASTVVTEDGPWLSYLDLFPSARGPG